ncbi:hypothetical protein TNCV_1629381 [Trichonephila clavipes]|uniref:PiggyBac transposable element-derived protein domain-containing protein n=1 Tax=Trichonephila clavipes TaxID=2585209 RepID=A0A8X6W9V9_TRICX|nr:hypothetical protein TNCV_1629381 [Trichonephila clavipes]
MDSESESEDSEFNIFNSKDDSSDLSTDDIFSESSESEDDDISSKSKMHSKQLECRATCKEEVKFLLRIWIMQGIVKKPVEQWYWSNDEKLFTPFF